MQLTIMTRHTTQTTADNSSTATSTSTTEKISSETVTYQPEYQTQTSSCLNCIKTVDTLLFHSACLLNKSIFIKEETDATDTPSTERNVNVSKCVVS